MKHFALYANIIMALLLSSCSNNTTQEEPTGKQTATATRPTETKRLVDENTFIDFDVNKAIDNLAAEIPKALQGEDMHKSRAALYRFYSHVTSTEDGYSCDLKSGADINVSENVFNAFMANLKETNAAIAQMKAKGMDVDVAQVDSAYLNSLLK